MTEEKIIVRSDNPNRDWVEDFSHENGNYQCGCMTCKNTFFGHKRRVVCKICDSSPEKPLHVKPTFYSYCYEALKGIAKEFGYNLVLHGSMNRDLDLIAIPWIDEPKEELEMICAFQEYLCGFKILNPSKSTFCYSVLPGNRGSYVISMNRAGKWNNYVDEQYYLDISITPLVKVSEPLSN